MVGSGFVRHIGLQLILPKHHMGIAAVIVVMRVSQVVVQATSTLAPACIHTLRDAYSCALLSRYPHHFSPGEVRAKPQAVLPKANRKFGLLLALQGTRTFC